ncbi:hypothetical protein C8J44_0101 [Sphingomonas sp. PP-CE-3A-406]|uniref:hypothetical protein n=1 Tax=Sphingomonas sp. PP-CE-3A-406 TaxID=2135659 RepID=UPI000EF883DA|nr:hypothetical protein [Sphingomonas sp. PP-CE-3A-406]RMB54873.1 hypothetical protein C8J44_0101 [Sphingomonas sp. PP-CE-3A-406]
MWAMAMEAEFEEAVEDRRPFLFALGCLFAAWREIGKHSEGRLILANYALALGLLIPMAALQFQQAAGFLSSAEGPPFDMTGAGPNLYLIWSQNSAIPILLITWLLLGMAHLCLAWMLVEGDWPRIVKCGTLIGAAMITLSLFMGVLMLNLSPLRAQVAELAIEFAAVVLISRWHIRFFLNASPEMPARCF